jgi:hypothetical protein
MTLLEAVMRGQATLPKAPAEAKPSDEPKAGG